MKKFILIALAAVLAISSTYAQSTLQLSPVAGDVVVNTAVVNKFFSVSSGTNGIAISATIVVNSGTGAGTLQVMSSFDGVNYINQGSAYTITTTTTQVIPTIFVTAPAPQYYKIIITGAGTENLTVKCYYRAPKFQQTP